MDYKKRRKPDIKKRSGFLSVAGWFQSEDYQKTIFEISKSFKKRDGEYKSYAVRLTENQMINLIQLIQMVLNENHYCLAEQKQNTVFSEKADNSLYR